MVKRVSDGLSAQIYYDLKKKIEEFEYKPGDQISESKLASVYDVSRTPIKHSLARLENEELIYVKPQIGTFVSRIDTKHVHEFFTIRMLLEVSILDEAITNLNDKISAEMAANILAQEQLLIEAQANSDIDVSRVFWKLDNGFHRLIFKSVKKEFIWNFILSQSSQFNRFRVISASNDIETLQSKVAEHKLIHQYITGQITGDARQLYEVHLFGQLDQNIKDLKAKYPDYFL